MPPLGCMETGAFWTIACGPITAPDECDGKFAVGESQHPGASVGQPTEPCLALPERRPPVRFAPRSREFCPHRAIRNAAGAFSAPSARRYGSVSFDGSALLWCKLSTSPRPR